MDARYTQDTSLAPRTQQTGHQGASYPASTNSFPQLNSLPSLKRSYSLSTTQTKASTEDSVLAKAFIQQSRREATQASKSIGGDKPTTWSLTRGSSSKPKAPGNVFKARSQATTNNSARTNTSLPYPPNFTLIPSTYRPDCSAGNRLRLWRPVNTRVAIDSQGRPIPLSLQDLNEIGGVALNSLQESTQRTYGAGLYAFHRFCDFKEITDIQRAPAESLVMQSFVTTLAGIYRANTITNYVAAVRAWHIVHGVAWNIGGPEMEAVVKGAKAMAPSLSAKAKRIPMRVKHIVAMRPYFSDDSPLDVAVFACLTSAFWATARLGELTVRTLKSFDPDAHVKRSDLGEKVDRKGLKMTTIHVPKTKASPNEGEELYWAKQIGASDPMSALDRHLELNNPAQDFHLFGYLKKGKMVPLTKRAFTDRLSVAVTKAKLPALTGHSIRIGSTLEYLLRGIPFDVMKVKGRWNSDAFHEYIRDHARVLAPYMQDTPPDTEDDFIRVMIPSARR